MLQLLKKWGLLISFVVGGVLPELHVYSWLMPYFVGTMLMITLTGMEVAELRPRREHFLLLVANLCMGLVPWGILHLLGYEELAESAFLSCIVGAAASSPVVVQLLGGKSEFAAVALLLNSVMASIVIPVFTPFTITPHTGLSLSRLQLFFVVLDQVLIMLILPCLIAALLRWLLPGSKVVSRRLGGFSLLLSMLSMALVSATGVTRISETGASFGQILPYFILAAVLCTCGFCTGRFIGGKKYGREVAQCLGQKNTAVGIYLGLCYCSPLVFLGPTLHLLCQHIFNTWQFVRSSTRRRYSAIPCPESDAICERLSHEK